MSNRVNPKAQVPEEERAFMLISGCRVLDFLATLRARHRDPIECLRVPADLDRWFGVAGLPPIAKANASDLVAARGLRETINHVVRAAIAGESADAADLRELNEWARRPILSPQLGASLQPTWSGAQPIQAGLALLAREAVELLGSPERDLIRECEAAPHCSRLYLDRSPSRRRRWCSMDWCGSRAKMTSYRRRRAAAAR